MKKNMKEKNVFVCGILAAAIVTALAFTACEQPTVKSSGNLPVTFTSIADFEEWLSAQPDNTATTAYTVKLNVNNLGGNVNTSGSIGKVLSSYNATPPAKTSTKYVSLDLSGSAITSIDNQAFQSCYGLTGVIIPDSVTIALNDSSAKV